MKDKIHKLYCEWCGKETDTEPEEGLLWVVCDEHNRMEREFYKKYHQVVL